MKLFRIPSFLVFIALLLFTPELYAQSLQLTQIQPLNGTPGTSFTIYGSGFDGTAADNTVTFTPVGGGSGTIATVTGISGTTKLTATVPSGLTGGNYTISVERASDATTASTPEVFSVITTSGINILDTVHGVSHPVTSPQSVHAADVDGDGDLDLISASAGDNRIAWFENDGGNTLIRRTVSDTATTAQDVYAADVDGDGDIDLISASSGENKIAWYENDGTSFTEHGVSHPVTSPQSVHAADVDGDGDMDLMSASSGDNRIAWFENTGDSTPTRRTISTNANGAQDVYAADVDGDGDIDLISASAGDDKIAWYENDGAADPSFTEHGVSHPVTSPQSVHAADVDGDGDIDLMSASSGDDRIAWFENDGSSTPTLTRRTISETATTAQDVYTADLDGDGDLDMLSASSGDDKIAWYENDGSQSFTEQVVSTDAVGAQSIKAHDVDGDGDLDLMSASSGDDKIAWHENDTPVTIYVDATNGSNSNNGLSWSAAFATLNKALSLATGNDQIWIAEGTYIPGSSEGDSFTITGGQDGLKIYGGFDGDASETSVSDRDLAANRVILSGNISGGNSDHVLLFDGTTGGTITSTTLLDGVTITGGRAEGGPIDDYGGGLYCIGNGSGSECSPTLRNVIFASNYAKQSGGAIYNNGQNGGKSSPVIINATFIGNTAANLDGGAINNDARIGGTSSPIITNATFISNHADGNGGAIYIDGTSSPTITNSIFFDNEDEISGGSPTVSYSLVEGGHTGTGNIDADPQFVNSSDPDGADNTFATGDDGLRLLESSPSADAGDNSALPGSVTTDITGAVRIQDGTVNMGAYESTVINTAPTVANPISDINTFENSVFTLDLTNVFTDTEEAESALTFSVTSNTNTGLVSTTIDNTTDDLTITLAADQSGTATITIEAADAAGLTASDDFTVSSFAVGPTIYVDANATGNNDGSDWTNAFTSLRDAFTAATSSDEIWIAEGTYYPDEGSDVTNDDRGASFTITGGQEGLEIYGGFASGDAFTDRNSGDHSVILSGDIGTTGDASDNSYHVLVFDGTTSGTITSATLLDGVTVTGGNANGGAADNRGGGLYCIGNGSGNECSPQITNVIFAGNSAAGGGAIYNYGDAGTSSPQITGSVFVNNSASNVGGAIVNNGNSSGTSSPTIINSTFNGNSTEGDGGAILNAGTSSPAITNSIFFDNGDEISGGTAQISFSLIESGVGSIAGATNGGSNLDANPQFVDVADPNGTDDIFGTGDDGLRLINISPAVNAGTPDTTGLGIPDEDLTGAARIQNGTVNMGAYEDITQGPVIYVDGGAGSDSNDGQSWGQAFATLTKALSEATGNDQIWIAEGTYTPGSNRGDSFTITGSQDELKIYGGFENGDAALTERNLGDHPVILSGDIGTASDSTDNSYHVLVFDGTTGGTVTGATVLDGVTVTDGNADGSSPDNHGGGLYCIGNGSGNECSPQITGSIFVNNTSTSSGGAIYNFGDSGNSSPQITGSIFVNNTSTSSGGAILNDGTDSGTSSPVITNTTFTGNSASGGGRAIFNAASAGTSNPTITNSIFWDNGDEIAGGLATPTISYSLVEGSGGSSSWDTDLGTDGGNNLDADPQFVDVVNPKGPDGIFGTGDDGLRLFNTSSAADAGNNDAVPAGVTTDITSANRIQNNTVNMGAYESTKIDPAETIYVDASATGDNNGSTWSNAYTSLQDALGGATGNDEVWIAEGIYYPDEGSTVTAGDEAASFTITGNQDGLKIYGGFKSGDGFADRNPADHLVVLSGDIDDNDTKTNGVTLTASDIDGGNTDHVLIFNGGGTIGIGADVAANITSATVLDGVTITGGNAVNVPDAGGGLFCDGRGSGNVCSPTLTNIVFTGNRASGSGGAILNNGGDGTSSPTITNAVFTGNSTSGSGGAIYNGGFNGTSSPIITNATFTGNSASGGGGALYNDGSSGGTSNPTVTNSIIYGNNSNEIFNNGGSVTMNYSLISGGHPGTGNIDANPLFVNTGDPDGADNTFGTEDDGLALQAGSPAIDTGKVDTTGLNLPSIGLGGQERLVGTAVDMGAYEAPLTVQITGSEGWRMMTAPDDGLSYADLLGDLWLQGMTGGDTEGGTANLYTWNEVSQEFEAISDASTVPDAGQGFIVYVYDDQDFDGTPEGFPKTLDVDETRNSGEVSPELTYNNAGTEDDGFNLVGNPYSSTINWDAASGWTKTNLQAPMYIWDSSIGDYRSHNGLEGTLEDALIAPWQGFWVQASDADPSLEFTDEVQSTGGEFLKEQKEDPTPQITFELVQCNSERCSENAEPETGQNAEMSSKALLMFNEKAKTGKDRWDAWKLESLAEQYLSLYTTDTERHALDINTLPKELESPLELNLDFKGSDIGGEYTLNWDPKALPDSWKEGAVTLTDLHTDRILNLNEAGEYNFKVESAKEKTGRVSDTLEVSKPPKGSKQGRFQRREVSANNKKGTSQSPPESGVDLEQPTHGPIPTVLKAKATNPRFVLTINPDATGKGLGEIPEETELAQNYPNPFNPETVIRYGVPEQSEVQLNVYDVLGRRVRTLINEQKTPGQYEVNFDASTLASGLYFYRLKVGATIITKKMTLIK